MLLEEALEHYEMSLWSKNLSKSTIDNYKRELKNMISYFESNGKDSIDDINPLDLNRYFGNMVRTNNRPSTRRRKRSTVRGFFNFLVVQGFVTNSPADTIESIKVTDEDVKTRDTLTLKESKRLLNSVKVNSVNKLKNVIIFKLFLECCVRVEELTSLEWGDVDWKSDEILVRGKGRKNRMVPIHKGLKSDLKEYKKTIKRGSTYIIPSKDGVSRISNRSIHHLVKNHVRLARIPKNIGCHSLRRTGATNYLREGVNVRYIQLLLGHSSMSTTTRYLDPDNEEIKKSLSKAHKNMKM